MDSNEIGFNQICQHSVIFRLLFTIFDNFILERCQVLKSTMKYPNLDNWPPRLLR